MLQVPLCLDASLYILRKAQINQVQDVSQKVTLHRTSSIIKAMAYSNIIIEIAPDSLVR